MPGGVTQGGGGEGEEVSETPHHLHPPPPNMTGVCGSWRLWRRQRFGNVTPEGEGKQVLLLVFIKRGRAGKEEKVRQISQ